MSTFRSQQAKTVIRMDILPPEHSGPTRRTVGRRGEVIDAQFVPVKDTFRRKTMRFSHNDNVHAAAVSPFSRLFGKGEQVLSRLSADFFTAVVAAVFVLVFSLAGGFSFLFKGAEAGTVKTALDITHVTLTPQDANGMRVLLISGIVENRSSGSMAMPSIRADLMAGEKVVATTLIAPPSAAIAGGRSRGFSARVPHPGGKLPDLRLSLSERGA